MIDAHLMLALAEGFGESPVRSLLAPDVEPEALLASPPAPPHVSPAAAARLRQRDLAARASEVRERAAARGIQVLTRQDTGWPEGLRRLPDAPLVLFARGNMNALNRSPSATMVGSRTPTPYGEEAARLLARALAGCGVTIWSGLARGVDALAHEACVRSTSTTVAVLAGGLDCIYPHEHEALADDIVSADGCLVSELPPGWRTRRGHFIRRNRIIAAGTPATIVVEGSLVSGALRTARFAAACGADVHCVPGPWLSERSRGCHRLITEGASIVEGVRALLQSLGIANDSAHAALRLTLSADEQAVLSLLSGGPRPTDLLRRESGLDNGAFLRVLLGLQRRGTVQRAPGDLWCLGVTS